jgi:hypothetical protein
MLTAMEDVDICTAIEANLVRFIYLQCQWLRRTSFGNAPNLRTLSLLKV